MGTKFGILSDLHLEFDHLRYNPFEFVPEPDVFYLNAGDTHTDGYQREGFFVKNDPHMFYIMGNHDFYGYTNISYDPLMQMHTREVNGFKIAGATLWTDLSRPQDWDSYKYGLVDIKLFPWEVTQGKYMSWYEAHKAFLLYSDADIIVSHHAPSFLSTHPRFKGDSYNSSFMSELYYDILDMKKPPKLWIHGHVHDDHDYMIGETRVICHPRGYPHEHANFKSYKPMIIEL